MLLPVAGSVPGSEQAARRAVCPWWTVHRGRPGGGRLAVVAEVFVHASFELLGERSVLCRRWSAGSVPGSAGHGHRRRRGGCTLCSATVVGGGCSCPPSMRLLAMPSSQLQACLNWHPVQSQHPPSGQGPYVVHWLHATIAHDVQHWSRLSMVPHIMQSIRSGSSYSMLPSVSILFLNLARIAGLGGLVLATNCFLTLLLLLSPSGMAGAFLVEVSSCCSLPWLPLVLIRPFSPGDLLYAQGSGAIRCCIGICSST